MRKILNEEPEKIAVFRALQLGDMLCCIPAVRTLKKAYPNSAITLIGLPWAEEFSQRFSHYFSGFIHFPGYPGIPEQPFNHNEFITFLQRMNEEKFDLIIQMHGNGSVINPMISMLGASAIAGYCERGRYQFHNKLFMTYPEDSEIQKHLALMEFLGIPSSKKDLEFPISAEEEAECQQLFKLFKLSPQQYVCVHPGARDNKRWWSPDKFAKAADAIAAKGYTIILTGVEAEKETVSMVEKKMSYPAINLAGRTGLGSFAGLIRNAKMLLCNDTGASHIAAAMKTPSLIIFLASDPERWAPLDKDLHHIILPKESDDMNYVLRKIEKVLLLEEGGYEVKIAM
jgi:ADP-heptose:LPS heptosyltransferase